MLVTEDVFCQNNYHTHYDKDKNNQAKVCMLLIQALGQLTEGILVR